MTSTERPKTQLDLGMTLYLATLKQLLTASPYNESAWLVLEPEKDVSTLRSNLRNLLIKALRRRCLLLVKKRPFDFLARANGEDWPMIGFTMVGRKRLDNIQTCIESVLTNEVPGDFVECGVWRGGSSIFARAIYKAYGVRDRRVWLADSFSGMPRITAAPDLVDPDLSAREYLTVSLEEVRENFKKFDLLDDQVQFLEGWFSDILPSAPIEGISVLRLDADHYSSTMDALINLYDKVSLGGYIIIDDYNGFQGCRNAVCEFLAKRQIEAKLVPIDRLSVFWQRLKK